MRNTKKPIQLYRGTTQQHSDYAGPVGEITVDTEKYTVVVQNGVTGGVPLAREDTVVSLTNRIAAEESARATADTALQKSITDEASARKAADTTLQNNIDNEASARETADTALSNRLDVVEPVLVASDFTGDTNTVKKYVDVAMKNRAPLESPALTGTPTAPTADKGTNTTQIATTAFVQAAISEASGEYEPECVVDKKDEFQYGHIRYSSGLQICYGWAGTFSGGNGSSKTFTYAKPFKVRPHVFCTPCNGAYKWESYNAETNSTTTTGTIKIRVTYGSADKDATVAFNWLAIGFWK